MEDYDALESLFESFRSYLKRNTKLPEYQCNSYLNLVSYTKKIAHLRQKLAINRQKKDENRIAALRSQIHQLSNVAQAPWLQRKLNELEG